MAPLRKRRFERAQARWPAADAPVVRQHSPTHRKSSVTTGRNVVYLRWTPEEISVQRSGRSTLSREPPILAVDHEGRIGGVGRESEAALKARPDLRRVELRDVATAWSERRPATTALSYLWLSAEFAERSSWWHVWAGFWPPSRSLLVVHPSGLARRGLGAAQVSWLRSCFRHSPARRTFIWDGEPLDVSHRLADTAGRGRWVGPAPRMAVEQRSVAPPANAA
jgi:hypothetical protein